MSVMVGCRTGASVLGRLASGAWLPLGRAGGAWLPLSRGGGAWLPVSVRRASTAQLRNVGIMAHVDAGKTTTSELMLYYSNYSDKVGTIKDGDTVLDYMEQERERGITITSAAITLIWRNHQINYIDTPGHVDFTMEVESAMAVLDGGIVVLDGSAGVEAQTVTVWRQAEKYRVPRIAFINKLDKASASIAATLVSMERRLGVRPLVIQQAIGEEGSAFTGVIDLVSMRAFTWRRGDGSMGKNMTVHSEDQLKTSMTQSWEAAMEARDALVEEVAGFDDELAEKVIEMENLEADVASLQAALRRVALNPSSGALVTLLGSSGAHVGVQPLMDALVDYCPAPQDRIYTEVQKYGSNFSGMVFKVTHDPNKGTLCFVRVFSGVIKNKDGIFNVNQKSREKMGPLLVVMADDYFPVDEVSAGNIAVLSGLKLAVTGDTLVASEAVASGADFSCLVGPTVLEPVVYCSMEPPSLRQQKQFDTGLANLCREDPSLRVKIDPETGQTVVAGMGELQLEILRDRMLKEYKVEVEANKLQISYRELLAGSHREQITFVRKIAGKEQSLVLEVGVRPVREGEEGGVRLAKGKDTQDSMAKLYRSEQTRRQIERGLAEGLERGPVLGCPVYGAVLTLYTAAVGRHTESTIVLAGAAHIARQLVREAGVSLAEPVMQVVVTTEQELMSSVMQDMQNRRGEVDSSSIGTGTLKGLVPMAELVGYSSKLRRELSGQANISMELAEYRVMSERQEARVIEEVTGFPPT